jgi:hypothetical protein
MTAYSAYSSSRAGHSLGSDDALAQEGLVLSYLLSFGVLLPVVALPGLAALRRMGMGTAPSQVSVLAPAAKPEAARSSEAAVTAVKDPDTPPGTAEAGFACGGLWAAGNFLGVHATLGLGQAIGFPLTQVCGIEATWGRVASVTT